MSDDDNARNNPRNKPGDSPGNNPRNNPRRDDGNGHDPDAGQEVFGLPPFFRVPRPRDADDGGDGPALSPRQRRAIPLVAYHTTITAASRAARISERTLHRWMTDPAFRDEVERARENPVQLCSQAVFALLPKAVEVLSAALDLDDAGLRLDAAIRITELWLDLQERTDNRHNLQDILDALESPSP